MAVKEADAAQKFLVGALVGFALGVLVVGGVVGLAGYAWVKRSEKLHKRGWNLVPVVVAAQDLPPGVPLTDAELARRPIPEQFATDSVVRPEAVEAVLHQPLLVPLSDGYCTLLNIPCSACPNSWNAVLTSSNERSAGWPGAGFWKLATL